MSHHFKAQRAQLVGLGVMLPPAHSIPSDSGISVDPPSTIQPTLAMRGSRLLYALSSSFRHLANRRTYVTFDVVRRLLRRYGNGLRVNLLMGITDIDDKIIAKATALGVPHQDVSQRFQAEFLKSLRDLKVGALLDDWSHPSLHPRSSSRTALCASLSTWRILSGWY